MPYLDCAQPFADCAGPNGLTRSLAARLWHADRAPSAGLRARTALARLGLTGAIGRVESAGPFEDAALERELKTALPDLIAAAVRTSMEWYGCRGAFFHNDAHYEGVLFGVWSIAGPARELVFPRIDRRLNAAVGSIVIFDPVEPHAVLDPQAARYRREDYETAEPNVFLGFEVALSPEVRDAFGIGPARGSSMPLSSRIAVNPETGALVRAG
jgi:hypothetical protein